jgi:hypothetical protein
MKELSPRELLSLMASKVKPKKIRKFYKKNSARSSLLFFQFFNTVSSMNAILKMFYYDLSIFSNKLFNTVKLTNIYFINTNPNLKININSNRRSFKLKKLKQYRHFFAKVFYSYATRVYKKGCSMIIKFNHFRKFRN